MGEDCGRGWSWGCAAGADDSGDDWEEHDVRGAAHDGGGLHESHAGGLHHGGGPRVGDDSALHAGEVDAPHHRNGQALHEHGVGAHLPGHDAHVDSSGHKLGTPPGEPTPPARLPVHLPHSSAHPAVMPVGPKFGKPAPTSQQRFLSLSRHHPKP